MAAADQASREASGARGAMSRHEVLASGILTGIAGGVAMMAVAMIGAASQDLEATRALRVMGESLVGPEALGPAGKIAFGAAVHLATSIALGTLLASILARDFPMASAIGVGVSFGLGVLMVMMTLVVPLVNPGFREGMQDIGGTWVIAHAVFGAAVGMAPALRRRIVRERSDAFAPQVDRLRARGGPVAPTIR
jgi:hypothetical protein